MFCGEIRKMFIWILLLPGAMPWNDIVLVSEQYCNKNKNIIAFNKRLSVFLPFFFFLLENVTSLGRAFFVVTQNMFL